MATTDETTDLPIFSINNGDKVIRVGLAGLELNNIPADTAFALSHDGIGLEYDITGTKKHLLFLQMEYLGRTEQHLILLVLGVFVPFNKHFPLLIYHQTLLH